MRCARYARQLIVADTHTALLLLNLLLDRCDFTVDVVHLRFQTVVIYMQALLRELQLCFEFHDILPKLAQ